MTNYSNSPGPTPVPPEMDWVEIPIVQLRRVLIQFLRELFSASPNPALKWDEDPKTTGIIITDMIPTSLEKFGRRPLIVVGTTGYQIMHLSLDDLEEHRLWDGRRTYSTLLSTTAVVSCVSTSEVEVQHIAWLVAKYVWLLKKELRKRGIFEIGRGIQISQVTPVGQVLQDSAPVYRQASVTFPVFMQQRHHVTPPYRPVRRFDVQIDTVSTRTEPFHPPLAGVKGTAIVEKDGDEYRLVRQDPGLESPAEDTVVTEELVVERGDNDG